MSGRTGRVLTVGYPSLDHIAKVERIGGPGETRIVETMWPSPTLGGCAANVAVALAKLGVPAAASFAVGDDPDSEVFVAGLQHAGVDTSNISRRPGASMPRSYLFLDGEESELYFDPGAMRDWDGVDEADLSNVDRLIATVGPPEANLRAVALARRRGIPVALQLKRDLTAFAPERLTELLADCDLVFANHEELQYLLRALDVESVADALACGPAWIAETRGSAGAVLHHARGSVEVPVVTPPHVAEPTGAGDAFTAGVVFGLMEGTEPVVAGRIGAVMASFAVEGWGCQAGLPSLDRLRDRYGSAFGEIPFPAQTEQEAM